MDGSSDDWNIEPSARSIGTLNNMTEIMKLIKPPTVMDRPIYSLAYGDPSIYEGFHVPEFVKNAVIDSLQAGKGNGYSDIVGFLPARQALAKQYSYDNIQLTSDDVYLDYGGSGALISVLQVLLNPGDNILMASPGFGAYKAAADNNLAETVFYNLKPESDWEVDLEDLERKITPRSKVIIIINPSNPCGSVFTKEHLLDILQVAERHKLCVLADEIYHNMTFGRPFYPLGSLTDKVPVFTINGLSKMFLVPGWRVGWILIYDKYSRCTKFRTALRQLKSLSLHPTNFLAQAIPRILAEIPEGYFEGLMLKVKEKADVVYRKALETGVLKMSYPQGAIYTMINIDFQQLVGIKDSITFANLLANEEGVIVLPAESFSSHSGFRVTLCHPVAILEESMSRVNNFINRHRVSND